MSACFFLKRNWREFKHDLISHSVTNGGKRKSTREKLNDWKDDLENVKTALITQGVRTSRHTTKSSIRPRMDQAFKMSQTLSPY